MPTAALVVQMLLSSLGNALGKWSIGEGKVEDVQAHATWAVELIFGQPHRRE